MKLPPPAIVIGLDGMNGLQTARILAAKGIPVFGLAKDPKHPCCRTGVCERIIQTDIQGIALIETLEDLAASLPQKAVLFPCYDMGVQLLSRNRARIEGAFHHRLPPPEVVELALDKERLYRFAMENGFTIPETRFLRTREEAEAAAESVSFPCVLKPPFSADPIWEAESLKAYKVFDGPGLLSLYDRCCHLADLLILQEWVEGPDSELYSCNCYYDQESLSLATFVARKERQWPLETGMSSMGIECKDDEVLSTALRFFQALGHTGLGYLEMKRNPTTGQYFLMEPNVGRPTGRSAIAEAGGVELLFTMYSDAIGAPLPEDLEQKYVGAKWVHLRRDFQAALRLGKRGELSFGSWLKSLRGPKGFALFSLQDPLPFLADIITSIPELLGRDPVDPRDLSHPGSSETG